MSIDRDVLEQYLDRELASEENARVEAAAQADAGVARLLERLRRERALRAAALASYAPHSAAACQAAQEWLETVRTRPVATLYPIRRWLWQIGKVAAVMAIAAGSFYAGQWTRAPKTTVVPESWSVLVHSGDGEVSVRQFASLEEAQRYADELSVPVTPVAEAEGGVF